MAALTGTLSGGTVENEPGVLTVHQNPTLVLLDSGGVSDGIV